MSEVNVITMPRLDLRHRLQTVVPPGSSIADMVAQVLPGATPDSVRTLIGDQVILPANRARVRPKPGTTVIIRAFPTGDRDVLRSVLLIAVTIAAVAVGQLWLAPTLLGVGAGAFATNAIVGISTTALAACATLDIDSSIPVRS